MNDARIPDDTLRWLPAGWMYRETVQATSPDRRMHVAVASEPLPAGVSLAAFAGRHAAMNADRLPGYELLIEETAALLGSEDAIVRTFSWAANERPRVTQVQAFVTVADRGYVATVTVPGAFFDAARDAIMQLLGTIRVAREVARAGPVVPVGSPADVGPMDLGPIEELDETWVDARRVWATVGVPS